MRRAGLPQRAAALRGLKALGFSDRRLSQLAGVDEAAVREQRERLGVRPVFKRIDTCAAEFRSDTSYMYSTFEGGFGQPACEARPTDRRKVVILGGGPNRIGQGIEFDYCCVHAAYALREAGFETIMVNCNPETVSTDYDTSDRLYFEPLTDEDVIALVRKEQERGEVLGCIVQYGGQTPLEAEPGAGAGGHPDPRHLRGGDRHRRGPRALPAAAARPRPQAAAERHRAHPGGGGGGGGAHRLSGGGAPELRARRPRHGDRPQPRPAPPLRARGGAGLGRQPDPDRPVPRRRHRGGRGLRRGRARARSTSPA